MKRVVLLIPINRENKVLLQHKSKDAPNNPNMWCLFGGAIEEGESLDGAIEREIKEELQIDIKATFFKRVTSNEIERNYFSANLDTEEAVLKEMQQEGDNLDYFSLEDMKSLVINQAHLSAIQSFLSQKSSNNVP